MVNDVVFNFGLVSGRGHPVGLRPRPVAGQCTSATAALGGQAALFGEAWRTFPFTPQLLIHLLRDQGDVLTQIVRETSVAVDRIEDQLRPAPLRQPPTSAPCGACWYACNACWRWSPVRCCACSTDRRNGYRMPTCELREATEEFSW